MSKKYSYPELNDDDFQNSIYHKREFYYHRVPNRQILKDYEEVKVLLDGRYMTAYRLIDEPNSICFEGRDDD